MGDVPDRNGAIRHGPGAAGSRLYGDRVTTLREEAATMPELPNPTVLGSYSHFRGGEPPVTVEDTARAHLGRHALNDDVTQLADAYRRQINQVLDGTGIVLHGNNFCLHVYSDARQVEYANTVVARALDAIDIAHIEAGSRSGT